MDYIVNVIGVVLVAAILYAMFIVPAWVALATAVGAYLVVKALELVLEK